MASKKLKPLVLSPKEKAWIAATRYGETGSVSKNKKGLVYSDKGARGSMQIMPATYKEVMGSMKGWNDPKKLEEAGIRYAVQQFRDFKGDPARAAGAYVRGPTAERENRPLPGPRTKNYIPKVVAEYKKLLNKSRKKQMADTSGYDRMSPKEKRSRIAQARRAIAMAKSVGMKPKASDLALVKNASKSASASVDRGPYAPYTEKQRAVLNKELPKSKKRVISDFEKNPGMRTTAGGPRISPIRRAPDELIIPGGGKAVSQRKSASDSKGTGIPSRMPIGPGRNPSEAEFGASLTGTGIPSRMPIGPGRNPSEAEFGASLTGTGIPSRMPIGPGRNPSEAEFGASLTGTGIPSRMPTRPKRKTAAKHILNDDPKLAQANELEGVKKSEKKSPSLGDIFKAKNWKKTSGPDDYSPAKRTYDTPFGEIDLDTSEEGMFGDSELYDMGQKKGGRQKESCW